MQKFKDRDFIRTEEDLFFCVIGYEHPSDRVISYLKYAPNPSGRWGKGGTRFRRVLPYYTTPLLRETFQLLEKDYPKYLFDSSVLGIRMSAVPLPSIKTHYTPTEKLGQMFKLVKLDPLQSRLLDLVNLLSDESGIPTSFFGVTGSILIDIHQPKFSDMDITISGSENSGRLKETLLSLYAPPKSPISRLKGRALESWCKMMAKLYPVSMKMARKIYERKWNVGVYRGTDFSIHTIKSDEEIVEKYGDRIFTSGGIVKVRAVVSDVAESPFLPATYQVKQALVKGKMAADLREVTTYESLYGGIVEIGEEIIVRGKLESVKDKRKRENYHRVLVGTLEGAGADYLRFV